MNEQTWILVMDALILDMDGVVVNTEPILFTIFRRIFEPLQIAFTDEYLYRLVGDSTEKNMLDVARDYSVALDIVQYTEKLHSAYIMELETVPIPLREGIADLLQQTKSRGSKIGLCTSSRTGMVSRIMQRIGSSQGLAMPLQSYFDVVVTGDMVRRKKPDPEPYLLACRLLRVQPSSSLVIEDSAAGIDAAKAAGCYCIALRAEYNRHMDFSRADRIIERVIDLL
jgi:beta-phosphoglucomutase